MIEIKNIVSFVPRNYISKDFLKKKLGNKNFLKIYNYTGFKKLHILQDNQKSENFFFEAINKFFKLKKIEKKR